tara:strand:+ start:1624 stop:1950 length:327 start_codon:yes stop_codon:yes gene_type:complete
MGQYTQGKVRAIFATDEAAGNYADDVENFEDYLAKVMIKDFDTNIIDFETTGNEITIELDSMRYPNAEWQLEQLFEMAKAKYKEELEEFSADILSPECIIFYEKGEEE